jgi:hypothetical protein
MRLGELLVSVGKLTPAQVDETLKGQAIFGGRFGTNLVEMGYLDEHDLAHFLSKKTGVPHAEPEQLMDIPPQVLRLIPEDLVRKYRVVPIGVNNRKLMLAMTDPSDFATIDEISFRTGYIIVPVVTPELRLVSALEKHYRIKRELRYIQVEGGGRSRGRLAAAAAAEPQKPQPAAAKPAPAPAGPEEAELIELPLLGEFELAELEEAELQRTVVGAPGSPLSQAPQGFTLDAVLRGLADARDRHGIAELIVNYTGQQFPRSALFLIKGGKASGWVAQAAKKPIPDFGKLELPLAEPSVLKVVAESRNYYLGPMPMTPCNSRLIAAMGGSPSLNNLLVPLMMMGRVVAILYVEAGSSRVDEAVTDLQRLMGKASLAFEILILRSKILLT